MTPDLKTDIDALRAKVADAMKHVSDLGYISVSGYLTLYGGSDSASLTVTMNVPPEYALSGSIDDRYKSVTGYSSLGIDEAMRKFDVELFAIPNVTEIKREQIIKKLSTLADEMKTAGYELEYINPLVEAAKKLSENALTDRSV